MKAVYAGIMLLASVGPAFAQTADQKTIMENIASLIVANQWCEDYIINKNSMAAIMIAAKIDLAKDTNKKYLDQQKEEFEKVMGKAGVNAYCNFAYKTFGPEGAVSGLMMKR